METWQRNHIWVNLPKLLQDTIIYPTFLARLIADGILGDGDVEDLVFHENAAGSKGDQTLKFYEIIQTRVGGYDLLKQALLDTNQSGAYTVLNTCNGDNYANPAKNFSQDPPDANGTKQAIMGSNEKNPVLDSVNHAGHQQNTSQSTPKTSEDGGRTNTQPITQAKASPNLSHLISKFNANDNGALVTKPQIPAVANKLIAEIAIDRGNASDPSHGNEHIAISKAVSKTNIASSQPTLQKNTFEMEGAGNTALHLASEQQNKERVKELTEHGENVNAKNKAFETPLHKAAKGQDTTISLRIIKFLIGKGADAFAKDNMKNKFLHILLQQEAAISQAQFHDIIDFLIKRSCSNVKLLVTPGWDSIIPLQLAVRNVEVEEATLSILKKNGIYFNCVNAGRNSLLYYAIRGGRSQEFLARLVKFGMDWKHTNMNGPSFLHIAAECGNLEAARFFLDLGLDISLTDSNGDTALDISMSRTGADLFQSEAVTQNA